MEIALLFFILCILFQIKHFVADYPLQTPYMLGKFKGAGWVAPLSAHCAVHMVFTLVVCIPLVGVVYAIGLALFDFCVHFVVDRIKASPNMWGRYKPTQPQFWNALGFDQMMHHITHYVIIFAIMYVMISSGSV